MQYILDRWRFEDSLYFSSDLRTAVLSALLEASPSTGRRSCSTWSPSRACPSRARSRIWETPASRCWATIERAGLYALVRHCNPDRERIGEWIRERLDRHFDQAPFFPIEIWFAGRIRELL